MKSIQIPAKFPGLYLLLLTLPVVWQMAALSSSPHRSAQAAATQNNGTIQCGQTVSGNIGQLGQQVTWTFSGNAGEAVLLTAVRTSSGNLSAYAELYDPAGNKLEDNWPGNGSTSSLTLPRHGTYTIRVFDRFHDDTGSFELHLEFTSGRCALPITCGQIIGRSLASKAQNSSFIFTGNAGEAVLFSAVRTATGNLSAYAELYNVAGNKLADNWPGNGGTESIVLPADGSYIIRVFDRFHDDTGSFDLNLIFTTGRCGAALGCGESAANKTLASKAQNDSYSFCGVAGSVVTLTAVRVAAGNLSAYAELYGPAGDKIGDNWPGNGSTPNLRLPVQGTYTIRLFDRFHDDTGVYNLSLSCLGPTCPTPSTLSAAGRITTDSGTGISGVTLNFTRVSGSGSVPAAVQTNATGYWSQTDFPAGGCYRVTPSLAGSSFTPSFREFCAASSGLDFISASALNAQFIRQQVPTRLTVGQSFAVSMNWRNSGSESWSEATNIRLGSQNPPHNFTWGTSRITLPANIRPTPGSELALSFSLSAPSTPGAYSFQWQWLKEGEGFFGEASPNVAITVERPVSGRRVLVLKGGHNESDEKVVQVLRSCGWNVTPGPETPNWNGTQANLTDFDVVVITQNQNWGSALPEAGAKAIEDYLRRGGAVVSGEWFIWALQNRTTLMPLMPVGQYCGYNSESSTTYAQVTPDPIINFRLPASFSFNLGNFAGTESCLRPRANATVFYSSSNTGAAGLLGWAVDGGRIISFSTLLSETELCDNCTNYRQLFCNAVEWAARKSTSTFSITGRVTTSNGAGFFDVDLAFTKVSGAGATPEPVRSRENGHWEQTGFQPGIYRVRAARPGYICTPAWREFSGESTGLDFVCSEPVTLNVRALCGSGSELSADVNLTPGGSFRTPISQNFSRGQTVRLEATGAVIGQCGLLTVVPSFRRWIINGVAQVVGQRIVDLSLAQDTDVVAEFIVGGTTPYKLYGLNFSPYIDGQDPNQGVYVSEEQIRTRLALIARYTDRIRTFGCTNGLEETGRLAREFGLQTAIGAWLSRDLAANEREIANLISVAQAGYADLLIVGSEVLLRGDLTEDQLIAYINRVKQAVPGIPVTTADVYFKLLEHPRVIAATNILMANLYAYWEGIRVDTAVAALNVWYQRLVAAAGGKPVLVSETGWPSCGETRDKALPSPENAAFYLLNFVTWARANNVPYFYFAALDEAWKARYEGPQGACWGICDKDGKLKPGMQRVIDGETLPDNWTMPGGPGQPRIEFTDVPAYGSFDNLKGQVWHVTTEQHKVAVYIFVNGGWWTKPTALQPYSTIEPSGRFVCDITTGGLDQNATRILALILAAGQNAPLLLGNPTLPPLLEQISLAKLEVTRQP